MSSFDRLPRDDRGSAYEARTCGPYGAPSRDVHAGRPRRFSARASATGLRPGRAVARAGDEDPGHQPPRTASRRTARRPGVVFGAVFGGVIGAATIGGVSDHGGVKNRLEGAAIGAVPFGLLGGLIGLVLRGDVYETVYEVR